MAALGLNTSLGAMVRVGPRHLMVVVNSTAVIFIIPLIWLLVVR